jgi:hypothetical protein
MKKRQNLQPRGRLMFEFGIEYNLHECKFFDLKQEVICNEFANYAESAFHSLVHKTRKILDGGYSCRRKNLYAQNLRASQMKMKHLLALKLYSDFDLLQRAFRQSYRSAGAVTMKDERMRSFYHWRNTLRSAFTAFTEISLHQKWKQPKRLYHGVSQVMPMEKFKGKYWGPLSTTTDICVARQFAGKHGMILAIKPSATSVYHSLDMSFISDFPNEKEFLLFDHDIEIETRILSTDFDRYYYYYNYNQSMISEFVDNNNVLNNNNHNHNHNNNTTNIITCSTYIIGDYSQTVMHRITNANIAYNNSCVRMRTQSRTRTRTRTRTRL